MQCHHCLRTHLLRGRPLAQYDNTDGVIVPWLSFDLVMRSCRSSSPKRCYSYLVSTLRPFCTYILLKTLILASWYPVETLTSLYYVSSPIQRPQSRLIRLSVPERGGGKEPHSIQTVLVQALRLASSYLSSNILEEGGLLCLFTSRSHPRPLPNPPCPSLLAAVCVCVVQLHRATENTLF